MPDLILGDLAPADASWVRNHTITCSYCHNVLRSLEDVCTSLDDCNRTLNQAIPAESMPSPANCLGLSEARFGFMETPVGDVLIATSNEGVLEISYVQEHGCYESLHEVEQRGFLVYERQDAVRPVIEELRQYFTHERQDFTVPVDLTGVTDFTRSVLNVTTDIPYGHVRTYGEVAGLIGKPGASRAVGNALGRNPIPVIIPCHRVILASGAMGWYTGGPEIKRKLLGIEGVVWRHAEQPPLPL
jgi:methylated-DNA-[protein]-cysteine S-methyltransferase